MKRPCLALLALLASLAAGLAAISPRAAEASTLGELFCAIEIVTPRRHDAYDDYCPDCPYAEEHAEETPRICTPPGVPEAEEVFEEAADVAAAPAAEAQTQIELNAASSTDEPDSETAWEEDYGEYYGEYYSEDGAYGDEYANEYESAADDEVVIEEDAVEEDAEPAADEVETVEEADFRYGDGYDPWQAVTEQSVSAPGPADLIVDEEVAAEAPAVVDSYDLYGRQVGDANYGHDYDAVEVATESDYEDSYENSYEYENEYDYGYVAEEEATVETETPETDEAEGDDEGTDETHDDEARAYFEEYYPDYYGELYKQIEASKPQNVEAPSDAAESEEAAQDDEAEAIIDELFDTNPTADAESDLPWADEAPVAESTEEEAVEVADRPTFESEYGSDYAEDYYRTLFSNESEEELNENLDTEDAETADPAYDDSEDSYDFYHDPCHDDRCSDEVSSIAEQIVVHCGRQIAEWTESLELVSMRLHAACLQLAELPAQTATK